MSTDTQIKSKERVAAHGEVFTNPREVNAMLDLVKPETERIDSRFLEPACGDGNFLIEILRRKLSICEARVRAKQYTQLQYEHDAIWAISSIYGIELLADNAAAFYGHASERDSTEKLTSYWLTSTIDLICGPGTGYVENIPADMLFYE